MHERIKVKNLNDLKSFACDFFHTLEKGSTAKIILLSGDLGVGKTAFVKAFAQCLGINEEITSPTFVIQKEYEINESDRKFKKMIHIDAYRLENRSELEYLAWKEIIANPEYIIFMEWPEQVRGIQTPDAIRITMNILEDQSREIILMR